jgi:hypothetical protein
VTTIAFQEHGLSLVSDYELSQHMPIKHEIYAKAQKFIENSKLTISLSMSSNANLICSSFAPCNLGLEY